MIKVCLATSLAVCLTTGTVLAAEFQPPPPDFKEVYDLVRTHLNGVTEAELNRIAVDSFVGALRPKVALVDPNGASVADKDAPVLSKALLLDGPAAYLRVAKIEASLPQAIREACRLMSATNKLVGLVLDLRYTRGDDYSAAAASVDLFLKQERKILDWGNGMTTSKLKTDALSLPIAVLVNHETSGAPEALAAALRETGSGLVVGAATAGHAMIAQAYPLKNGEQLRIATAPVRLGDGSALSSLGVKPDIAVDVNPREERAYYADGFKDLSTLASTGRISPGSQAASTNRVRRPRFNEAELVRERREGLAADLDAEATAPPDDKPIIRDPALARAVDVLKGLAVVRAARGS